MLLKKRQVITATLIIALGAAVAVNWYYTDINGNTEGEYSLTTEDTSISGNLGDSVLVAGTVMQSEEETTAIPERSVSEQYFSQAKIKRNQANDKISEEINEILKNTSLESDDVARLESLYEKYQTTLKNEVDIENLVYAKTGKNCIAVINADSCQVIVDKNTLNDTIILQITEIVEKNSHISAENLSIIEIK